MADKVEHPARYSKEIITVMRGLIDSSGVKVVHDPFAGTGQRLGALCDELGVAFSGTEIEKSFIVDDRVNHGDSTFAETYPGVPYVLVTSPVYPNGIADHHEAKDASERNTYRAAVKANEGEDRELHENNMGRYGYRNTKRPEDGGRSIKRKTFWDIAEMCVPHWEGAEVVIVNVSDFKSDGGIEPFSEDWMLMMERHGWKPLNVGQVGTKRYKNGSDKSRDERVDSEWVLVYVRG